MVEWLTWTWGCTECSACGRKPLKHQEAKKMERAHWKKYHAGKTPPRNIWRIKNEEKIE